MPLQKFNTKKPGAEKNKKVNKSKTKRAGSGAGGPENNVSDPCDGFIYVDEETADTFVYLKKLGWIDLSSWQPEVGEGAPSTENPKNPLTGDQYLDILTSDFYVYNEGVGWVLVSGIEGPQGPPGNEFEFELVTKMGPTGPTLSGPLKVQPGKTVQLWIDNGQLYGDVI